MRSAPRSRRSCSATDLLALGISLVMILVYIWFRFEWQFAVGAVVTLILDVTKAIGFLALTRIEFDLVMVAAILTDPGLLHQRQGRGL